MTMQRGGEPPELYPSPVTVFSTPSRASIVMPVHGNTQLTTTVPVRRQCVSNPDASYMGYVREYVPSPSPAVLRLGKPRHCHIPLPSQTESDTAIIIHPLLRPSRGEKIMELDFARSLSSVRILGHEGCVKEMATSPPLPSLAIVHPKLPWPIVIQRSGNREWVAVADVVETLWHALQTHPMKSPSPSLLGNQDDAPCTSCRRTSSCVDVFEGRDAFYGTPHHTRRHMGIARCVVGHAGRAYLPTRPSLQACISFARRTETKDYLWKICPRHMGSCASVFFPNVPEVTITKSGLSHIVLIPDSECERDDNPVRPSCGEVGAMQIRYCHCNHNTALSDFAIPPAYNTVKSFPYPRSLASSQSISSVAIVIKAVTRGAHRLPSMTEYGLVPWQYIRCITFSWGISFSAVVAKAIIYQRRLLWVLTFQRLWPEWGTGICG
ncbi:hypothetical protein EDD85DRAFT_941439 [Armillaria nabsnona]|nr:hypothetical protein EDD85DRAFT_941439 [Armillaria nabsnona]